MCKIIRGTYQGYLWQSDKTSPLPEDIYLKPIEINLEIKDNDNPFIIEGLLYDPIQKESISIKYVDGKHRVSRYIITESDKVTSEEEYVAHRLPGIDKLCFKRLWRPERDSNCLGMEVLQPNELLFVGFKVTEDKQ